MKISKTLILFICMGFFGNLFSQTQPKHNEDWDFYFSTVNDLYSSIMVDLGLHSIAPIRNKTNLCWIALKLNNPNDDGLSTDKELETLSSIEDNLEKEIKEKNLGIYVGRLTSNGERDFYYYLNDTKNYEKTVKEVLKNYSSYKFEIGNREEKGWSTYFELLYPAPIQFQSIQNRRVIDNLEKNGDKLVKAREVFHWIYFKNESDRESFLKKIEKDNFVIVSKSKDNKLGEFKYSLQIKRIDKIDHESADEYILYLWKIAGECNGDYDGWETSVEKD